MFQTFQIATILLVAVAMASAVGHALELPGKLRLSKDEYLLVQPIYYPGYTIVGGFAEVGGLLATLALALMNWGAPGFALTLAAFLAMTAMHGTYWLVTHPVNNFWLGDRELSRAAKGFFGVGAARDALDWREARDHWELSHAIRGALSLLALALLVTAAVIY